MDFHQVACALILWRSGFGLLMGKFRQIFTELSACGTIMAGYYSLTFLLVICVKLDILWPPIDIKHWFPCDNFLSPSSNKIGMMAYWLRNMGSVQ